MYKTHYRTNTCGELAKEDIGKKVVLAGWDHSRRDHGGIIFIDLRDRFGMTQVVFDPNHNKSSHTKAENLRSEFIIQIKGAVRSRPQGMTNEKLKTGEIEVLVDEIDLLSRADTPVIEIDDRVVANDEMRLKYRFLDLRRPIMIKNLELRNKAMMAAREFFESHGFLDVETPILVRATPEGARDYIVPSRVNPGKFYALPQSPQLYKQILMISGIDRYYQFARCLRDEDLRADRQPEHTQMDLEMSFANSEDIMDFVESLFKHMLKKVRGITIKEPFTILTYKESMDKYGIDKPDIRFGLELHNVTDIAKETDFSVFKQAINNGSIVKCICAPEMSRKDVETYIDFCIKKGAKGMAWMKVADGKKLESNIAKYFNENTQEQLIDRLDAKKGEVIMFIADKEKVANQLLSELRLELGKNFKLYNDDDFRFCWVKDFPLYEWNDKEQAWTPCHHIFSMPKKECLDFLEKDPSKVLADLFDVVLNGLELGSGSIRINDPDIQKRCMKVIGLTEDQAMDKFGFLIEAYKFGGPPHGGMGLGFDRFVALMAGTTDIREVIAFPKNKSAQNPMDGSPSDVDPQQLREAHIRLDIVKKQ